MKREYCVYYLIKNGDIFYIGLTRNPDTRQYDHQRRYGKDLKLIVIESYKNRFFAYSMETYWIHQFIAWGFKIININGNPSKNNSCINNYYKSKCKIKSKPFNSLNKN